MFKKFLVLQLFICCLVSNSFSSTVSSTVPQDNGVVPLHQNNNTVNTDNNNNLSFGQKVKQKSSQIHENNKRRMHNLKVKTKQTAKKARAKSKQVVNKVKNKSHVMSEKLKYNGKKTEQKINQKASEITNKIKSKMNKK